MPQGRIVLKRICQSKKLAALKTDGARLLYTWLLPNVDINGCFSADVEVIKGQIFTRLKKSTKSIGNYLEDLHNIGLIIVYQANGDDFLQIPDFTEKQPSLNPNKEAESTIPPPTQEQLQTYSGLTPRKVKESKVKLKESKVKLKESKVKLKESKVKSKFIPPNLKEVNEYIQKKNLTIDGKKFLEYYSAADWHDQAGKPVRSWKQKMLAIWDRPDDSVKVSKNCNYSGCPNLGVYFAKDDTGQPYWRCEEHKPKWKPILPKELTDKTLKTVSIKDSRSLSDKQNEQKNKLGVR